MTQPTNCEMSTVCLSELDGAMDMLCDELVNDWPKVARELGFKSAYVDNTRYECRSLPEQIRKFLEDWIKQHGKEATVKRMEEALAKSSRQDLQDNLNLKN